MTSLTQYKLVDENTELQIPADYDPLLKDTFEEYIQITEKTNPGKRSSFNNIPDQETRDIHVSGLVLNWSDDLSQSKLRAVPERGNIENLYLYADTVVVNTRLQFSQTNVTIYARRLIMREKGKIDTTPTPFVPAYAQGEGSPKGRTPNAKTNSGVSEDPEESGWHFNEPFSRDNPVPLEERPKYPACRGADGASAGNINLFVKTYQLPSAGTCLILNGSDGQHGEKGGPKERVTSSQVPASWEKVLNEVLDFDPVRGSEGNWAWAPDMKKELQGGDVYYAKVTITNVAYANIFKPTSKTAEFGDWKVENQDNGLDAYASGDGGNGGNGGTVRMINRFLPAQLIEQKCGQKGISEKVAGSSKSKDSKKLRKIYNVCHRSAKNAQDIANMKSGARELNSRNGYAVNGQDGVEGKAGGLEFLVGQGAQWLHPYVLKTVVQYAKDAWLAGDRRPAKWLLTKYRAAFRAYDDPIVQLWEASTGRLLATLAGHAEGVFSLAWSPDGMVLASGSRDKTVKLWDASTGRLLATLAGHADWVKSIAWSPNGKVLASGADDSTVKLWDTSTGRLLATLEGRVASVGSVAWNPGGKVLASGNPTVKLWDASTGRLLSTLEGGPGDISSVAWSPDGKVLASGADTLKLWDASAGILLSTLAGHAGRVFSVAWSPDGKVLASGAEDNSVKLWDVSTGKLLSTLAGHATGVFSVAWSPEGNVLASGSRDSTVKLWDPSTGELLATLPWHADKVWSVAWSPDGKVLASGTDDGTVRLWDASAGKLLSTVEERSDNFLSVACSPDGKVLASGCRDQTVKLWNASTGKPLSTLEGRAGKVWSVAWSPDGRVLASGADTLKLWDASAGILLSTLAGHAGRVFSVAWSPDGKVLASGADDNTVKLWDPSTGKLLATFERHAGADWSVAWSPDGQVLASASGLPALPDHLLIGNLRHEIDVFLDKINDNLDYFGNPVGWVPRLSALTNLEILKQSHSVIVKLLYYANNLELENQKAGQAEDQLKFMINQLKKQIETGRKSLVTAYGQLDGVKIECDAIDGEIRQKRSRLRELNDQITRELKDDAAQQAIFTGALKLATGLLHVIPVGQPYLGGVGGGLLDNVSKIDIHSDNPLGETFKTMSGVATDLKTFVQDNKDQLTEDLTSPLTAKINSAQGAINTTDTFIGDFKAKLAACDKALEEKFGSELETLREGLKRTQSIKTKEEAKQRKEELEFIGTSEWIALYTEGEEVKERIKEIEGWNAPKKTAIVSKISALESEKKELLSGLKDFQTKKEARTSEIKKAAEFMNGVAKGIGGIGDGLQTMMARVDESSEDFRKKIQQAQNGKLKRDFENLSAEIDKLNARKLNAAQKLMQLEGVIQQSSQTINTNLVAVAGFSNQRAEATEQQLTHITKLFLKKVIQDTRELLLAEVYYLVKSYQYRFVEKVKGSIFDMQKIIDEVINFFTKNGRQKPDETDYADAFKFVLQGKLIELAKSLLTDRMQNMSLPGKNHYSVTFTPQTVRTDGVNLLSELNQKKQVSFKLHELGKGDSKGSGEEYFYRIEKIVFKSIDIAFSEETRKEHSGIEKTITFSFGIKHAGDSIIRAKDGQYYYFTTRSHEMETDETAGKAEQNIMAWTANYNGAEADLDNKGLTNTTVSATDWEIWKGLLTVIATDVSSVTYSEHLPGATSDLTLFIAKNQLGVDFEIKKLAFDFYYENMG